MFKINSKISFALLFFVSSSSFAQVHHFREFKLNSPPQAGTLAFEADLIKLHVQQLKRTPDECKLAEAQTSFSLRNTFGPDTGVLTEAEVKQAKWLSIQVMADLAPALYYFKHKFNRLRPYIQDKTLNPCITLAPNPDQSYPSGHSAMGYAFALALADLFPAKRELIMKQGLQVGENRILGGVHFPSDVEAGRDLARQVIQRMNRD